MSAILDIAALLQPITPDKPEGDALAPFTETYAAIEEAKRADQDGVRNAKKADWRDARKKAETALKEKGKDLYVACALVESLYYTDGVEGLAEGVDFLREFLNAYWDIMYPALAGDDEPERRARFDWLEEQLAHLIRTTPLTAPLGTGKPGYDLLHWQQAQSIRHLANTDPNGAEAAVKDGGVSVEMFDQAASASPASMYLALKPSMDRLSALLSELTTTTVKLLDGTGPNFTVLKEVLSDCRSAVEAIMLAKGLIAEKVDVVPGRDERQSVEQEKKLENRGGPVMAREEALRELQRIASFFRETEPHSPVSYLILRAEKWARMPLDTLLVELIGDNTVLENLKTLLNLNNARETEL